MAATAFALLALRNLFGVVMLTGIFSLLAALLWVVMDAVDVAFTEAAVGAGISTILMLGTLVLTTSEEKAHGNLKVVPLVLCLAAGGLLIWGTFDMPRFGDPLAPIHQHVADRYVLKSGGEVGPPNIVTSVLASYRGYDTLGETTVIFTAAAGVLALLGRGQLTAGRRRRSECEEWDAWDDSPHETNEMDDAEEKKDEEAAS